MRNPDRAMQKICVEGQGKGRIEFLQRKLLFSFESAFNHKKKTFDLALDFPLVGESTIEVILNPKEMLGQIERMGFFSQLRDEIYNQVGNEAKYKTIENELKEFFVLLSEFLAWKKVQQLPEFYNLTWKNEHLFFERQHGRYLFLVDAFYFDSYARRLEFSLRQKGQDLSASSLVLFLAFDQCDTQ